MSDTSSLTTYNEEEGSYYTSAYSGEEIDAAVAKIEALTENMTVAALLEKLSNLESRIAALEGGA